MLSYNLLNIVMEIVNASIWYGLGVITVHVYQSRDWGTPPE